MQELEKILEEIDEATRQEDAPIYCGSMEVDGYVRMSVVEGIIRKHVHGKDTNVPTNDGWISVEDRLPEDDVDVLVTYADIDDEEYADITTTTYGNAYLGGNKLDFKEWRSPFEYFKSNYKVTAWQYLPEPYRPERSGGE